MKMRLTPTPPNCQSSPWAVRIRHCRRPRRSRRAGDPLRHLCHTDVAMVCSGRSPDRSGSGRRCPRVGALGRALHFIAMQGTELSTVSTDLPWDDYLAALRPQGKLCIAGIPIKPVAAQRAAGHEVQRVRTVRKSADPLCWMETHGAASAV